MQPLYNKLTAMQFCVWNGLLEQTSNCLSWVHANLKCEDLGRSKALVCFFFFEVEVVCVPKPQTVSMLCRVNHNRMGETTGLQFIIAPVKIIYHLSTTSIRELRIFTVSVNIWFCIRRKTLWIHIEISASFKSAW